MPYEDQRENREIQQFCMKCGGRLQEKSLFCGKCGEPITYPQSPITNNTTEEKLLSDECSKELLNSDVAVTISEESKTHKRSNSKSNGKSKMPVLLGLVILIPIIALIIGFLMNGDTGRETRVYVERDSPLYAAELGDVWISTGGAAGGAKVTGYVVTSRCIMTVPAGTEVSFVYGEDSIQRSNDEYYYCIKLQDGTVGFIEISRIVQVN